LSALKITPTTALGLLTVEFVLTATVFLATFFSSFEEMRFILCDVESLAGFEGPGFASGKKTVKLILQSNIIQHMNNFI
jgi:hypothetical protein